MAFREDYQLGESLELGLSQLGASGVSATTDNADILTPSFFETHRIISPESEVSKKLAGMMQPLAEKLLGKKFNAGRHQFTFLFSDDPNANGFIIPAASPPIIVTSRGLIENAGSIDEVAGYLAHELGHLYVEEEFGSVRKGNSKVEEMGADIYSLKSLMDAGFSPKGITNLLQRIDSGKQSSIVAILDVHPLNHNRVSVLQKTTVVLARDGYPVDRDVVPLPDEWKTSAKSVSYEGAVKQKSTLDEYEKLSPEGKLAWIRSNLDELGIEWSKTYPNKTIHRDTVWARVRDLRELYSAIKIDTKSPVDTEAVHQTFDAFAQLGFIEERKILYKQTLDMLGLNIPKDGKWPLVGSFRDLQRHTDGFLAAETADQAINEAKALSQVYYSTLSSIYRNQYSEEKGGDLIDLIDLRGIVLPDYTTIQSTVAYGPYSLPISKHLVWLKETEDQSIGNALGLLGAKKLVDLSDGRIRSNNIIADEIIPITVPDINPPDDTKIYINLFGSKQNKKQKQIDAYMAGLLVDASARVTRVLEPVKFEKTLPFVDSLPVEEQAAGYRSFVNERVTWERSVVDGGVGWELLTQDTDKFYKIYRAALLPLMTFEKTEHPFAAAVAEKVESLHSSNPEKAQDVMRILMWNLNNEIKDHASGQSIPDTLKNLYRFGIDPDHPIITAAYAFSERKKLDEPVYRKGNRVDEEHKMYVGNLLGDVRYTDVFVRDSPFDESHLHITREMVSYNGTYNSHIDNLSKEFAATDIAKEMVEKSVTGKLTLEEILRYNKQTAGFSDSNTLKAWLTAQIPQYMQVAKNAFCQQPLEAQINQFQYLEREKLFADAPALRSELISSMVDRIGEIDDPIAKKDVALALLYSKETVAETDPFAGSRTRVEEHNYSLTVPEVRKNVARFIAEGLAAQYGIDDGSGEYEARLKLVIDDLFKKTGGTFRVQVLSDVADHLNIQRGLATHIRTTLPRESFLDLSKNDIAWRVGEFLHEKCKLNDAARTNMINLLANPYDESRAVQLYDQLKSSISGGERDFTPRSKEAFTIALSDFHANFWDAPLTARSGYLSELLFPEGSSKRDSATINQILDHAIGRSESGLGESPEKKWEEVLKRHGEKIGPLLHILQNSPKDSEAFKEAKAKAKQASMETLGGMTGLLGDKVKSALKAQIEKIGWIGELSADDLAHLTVRSYLEAVEPAEAQLLASALLAANKEQGEGGKMSMGKTLSLVLSNMGPAGAKMLQAIHSHPATPEDIREEVKSAKIMHDKPTRWDAISWAEETGLTNEDNPQRVRYFGPVIGAGSFGVTMINEDMSGEMHADTLLRPRAAEKTAREFKLIMEAARNLTASDARMAPVLDMIAEAERSARIETRMELAAKQNEVARQVYDGMRVKIIMPDGHVEEFTHHVTELSDFNQGYKRVGVVGGEHFNDAKEPNSDYRLASAKAMIVGQLVARMAGLPVDRDRHGGNIKTEGGSINHFDFGAMEVLLPTADQKRALGTVLAQAVKNTGIKGGEFSAHLVDRIDQLSAPQETKHFLAGFKREMLALGDFMNAGVDSESLKGMLGIAIYGDTADPTIQSAFKSELGLLESKVRGELQQAAHNSGISLQGVALAETLKLPELTEEETNLFRGKSDRLTYADVPHHLLHRRLALQSSATGGIGVGMSAMGLYGKVISRDTNFWKDIYSNDGIRIAASLAGITLDSADVLLSTSGTVADAILAKKLGESIAEKSAAAAGNGTAGITGLAFASKLAQRVAIPLALASGGSEVTAGLKEGNAERSAGAIGSTSGGIGGGIIAGAGAGLLLGGSGGSVVPGIGTLVIGSIAGLGGAIAGGIVGEKVAKEWLSDVMELMMYRSTNDDTEKKLENAYQLISVMPLEKEALEYITNPKLQKLAKLAQEVRKIELNVATLPNGQILPAQSMSAKANLIKSTLSYLEINSDIENAKNQYAIAALKHGKDHAEDLVLNIPYASNNPKQDIIRN